MNQVINRDPERVLLLDAARQDRPVRTNMRTYTTPSRGRFTGRVIRDTRQPDGARRGVYAAECREGSPYATVSELDE